MKTVQFWMLAVLILTLAVGCGPQAATPDPTPISATATETLSTEDPAFESPLPTPSAAEPARTLVVMTHDSFDASVEVIEAFKGSCNCDVKFLKSGDTGLMLNQAILSKGNPLADVIYGVDNTFLSRALDGDILEPYESPLLADIPGDLKLDPSFRLSPVDFGDVCLNYDIGWFEEHDLAPPDDLPALTQPAYRGLTVVENPATSSPGLAFLLATVGRFGQDGDYTYLDYWADLRANDLLVTSGWEDAYWGAFTYASDGDRPIVVSYASSPPVEVFFAEEEFDQAPTAVVAADGSCFRQIEFVGILRGTPNRDLADLWIDFMLGATFQEDIPLKMFVFPANSQAALPDVFGRFAQVPASPATVAPDDIEANRESWIHAWTQTVLR